MLDDGYSKPNQFKFSVNVELDPNTNRKDKYKGFQVSKAFVMLKQVTRDGKLRM
jgi:hypothetical protein